jgi:hypothetical protein
MILIMINGKADEMITKLCVYVLYYKVVHTSRSDWPVP